MVGAQHFRNLEHQYTEADEATAGDDARVTFGRAVLEGTVTSSGDVVQRMPHHRLLSDVATLAANSLVKDAHVASDEFDVHVAVPDYEGPVQAIGRRGARSARPVYGERGPAHARGRGSG